MAYWRGEPRPPARHPMLGRKFYIKNVHVQTILQAMAANCRQPFQRSQIRERAKSSETHCGGESVMDLMCCDESLAGAGDVCLSVAQPPSGFRECHLRVAMRNERQSAKQVTSDWAKSKEAADCRGAIQ
jgi:hypothetical protein